MNKLEMIENYIKSGVSPILLEEVPTELFHNAVVLDADCDDTLLTGHYEDVEYVAPKWYGEVVEKSENAYSLLLVPELNGIPEDEQLKFMELFKYKKISTFDLPENCVIVVTCSGLKENPLAEDIYRLMVHI